jgi:transmembrane sensor
MLREALTTERLSAMAPDEAAACFITRREEGLTESEQYLFDAWLAADGAHALAFDQAERSWRAFDRAEGDEILNAMRAHAIGAGRRRREMWPRLIAVAAMLCLVVTATLIFGPSWRRVSPGPAGAPEAWTQYASAHGQVRSFTLPDGSTMTLDAESVAQTRFRGSERAVRLLHGRGFFEVTKDPARPFAVAAADRRVVALGTRFEVALAPGSLRVTLLRGRVAVEPLTAGQTTILNPGQQFIEQGSAISVRTIDSGSEDQPGWRKGLIDLDDLPLGEAAMQINLYARNRIIVRDPAVARMRVSGQFRAGDPDRFAQTITEMYPLRAVRHDGAIELVPAR